MVVYTCSDNGLPDKRLLRTGIYVEEGQKSLFYGLTWLGREFQGQPSGQLLGSVALRLKF